MRFYSVVKEQYSNSGPLGPNLHYNSNLICCQLLIYDIKYKFIDMLYMLFNIYQPLAFETKESGYYASPFKSSKIAVVLAVFRIGLLKGDLVRIFTTTPNAVILQTHIAHHFGPPLELDHRTNPQASSGRRVGEGCARAIKPKEMVWFGYRRPRRLGVVPGQRRKALPSAN